MMAQNYGEFLKGTFESPIVEAFQTRLRRRAIVIAVLAWAAMFSLAGLLAPENLLGGALLVLLGLVFFPLASLANMAVRGVTEIPESFLDERLSQLSGTSFRNAYFPAVLVAFLSGLTGFALAERFGAFTLAVNFAAFALALGAPALLIAWKLPDETADDGEDHAQA